jgi:hypothetical protein
MGHAATIRAARLTVGGTMTKTAESPHEVFKKHLPYEIVQLIKKYKLALDPNRYVTTDAEGRRSKLAPEIEGALDDALHVGFCTHARNLLEFFFRKTNAPYNYAIALDYATEPYKPLDRERDDVKRLYKRLCDQINHLTYERTSETSKKILPKERKELINLIHNEARRLSGDLMSKYDAGYLHIDQLAEAAAMEIKAGGVLTSATITLSLSPKLSMK